jgi:RimJ/RimL family protein N-acetyltransferase
VHTDNWCRIGVCGRSAPNYPPSPARWFIEVIHKGNHMIPIDRADRKRLSKLFQSYTWNYLPDAVLEGSMGEARVDDEATPHVAVLELPKLKLFIPGGDASHPAGRAYMENLPRIALLIFASEGWKALLEESHAGRFIGMQRYAFTSETLDHEHLRRLASRIPPGYQLKQMDVSLAKQLAAEKSEFAAEHMLNFDSPEDFIARGFGFCVLEGNEIVSAATTFVICTKGIEIQVSTREKQRRKGLATAVAAQLLIHSLENRLDPNWDADNERSARLATKLGYTPQGTYNLWLVAGSRTMAGLFKLGLRIKEFFGQ